MRQPIPFAGPSFTGRSVKVQAQRSVNLYPVGEKPGAKGNVVLYSDPGLPSLGTIGVGPCRSHGILFQGKLYFVSGNELVCWDSSFNAISLGTIATSAGRVHMAENGTILNIVDGNTGKSWDGTSLITIADANFPDDATHIVVIDGHWFANNPANVGRFYQSVDGVTWAATAFATAEGRPDALLALSRTQSELILHGEKTTEIWGNTGASPFPFQRHPSGVKSWGIAAADSVAESSVGVFWLANVTEGEVKVVHFNNFQLNPISDEWADWKIGALDTISDAIGHVYQQRGQWYYQLTFPTSGVTLVYSITQQLWHERKSWGIERHLVNGHGFINRRHIVGHHTTGEFFWLDFETFKEGDDPFERLRRSPVIHKSNLLMTFWEVVVEFEAGVGLVSGEDPMASLRYSDDGGKTWSDWMPTSIGKIGEYETIAVWTQLGDSRERVFEVKVTDPVNVTIMNAYAEVELSDT